VSGLGRLASGFDEVSEEQRLLGDEP